MLAKHEAVLEGYVSVKVLDYALKRWLAQSRYLGKS